MFKSVTNLRELHEWWECTGGGKNGDACSIESGAVINNCDFITSLENIRLGDFVKLNHLTGLRKVDPCHIGQIGENCTLGGLKNVDAILWRFIAEPICLQGLQSIRVLMSGTIPAGSRLTGLRNVRAIRDIVLGEMVSLTGLTSVEAVTRVEFGCGSKLTGLKALTVFQENIPSTDVTLGISSPRYIKTSCFKGFNGLILTGVKYKLDFDAPLPMGAKLIVNAGLWDSGTVMFSKNTELNCKHVNSICDLSPLWNNGALVPLGFCFTHLMSGIRDNIPGWVRCRSNLAA